MEYRHTQTGRWMFAVAATIAVVIAVAVIIVPDDGPVVVPLVLFAVIMVVVLTVFSRLTVTVGSGSVRAAFGWGWPSRSVALADVVSVRVVRNRWYHGWGIRLVSEGWMFNVSGYDAVDLELRSGRHFRIGTDEPQALNAALTAQRLGSE